MLEVKNLKFTTKSGKLIFDNLNLKINQGEIFGLLGSNGSGKTTLFKQIFGISQPQEGEIFIKGQQLSRKGNEDRTILKHLGSLIETPSIYDYLTARQHLKMLCNIYETDDVHIVSTLELVNLTSVADQKTKTYSLGMKQRLGIAMALVTQPDFVLLDEPLNGLDPEAILCIRNIITDLNKNFNITFLISSHILSEIELTATHIGILHKGNLIYNDINPFGQMECLINNELITKDLENDIIKLGLKYFSQNNQTIIYLVDEKGKQDTIAMLLKHTLSEYKVTPCNIEHLYKRYTLS
ncbi:ATP-binding cassette domain-containing protein [Pedobacter gandavensis]|uniref:ATP-binding cassette domain-containing protein n=1 Tax=Pedobacter gandavensis TaxID=2679963 RepID=A0ABR6ETL8_9SPHI|nr:ATP-binding cassette domain-containing protein [Pedobacter gandavensis]MBB2148321.1 ATP-binding cassette domain-containing protein [Pedobacter gandavensis]